MTKVEPLVIPIEVRDEDVDRELRRRGREERRRGKDATRTTTGSGKKGGLGGAAVLGGVAGVVVGALAQNDAVGAVLELLVNMLAAAFLPLLVALLPLVEALAPLAGLLVAGLVPLVGLLADAIAALLRWLGKDDNDPGWKAVLKAAGRGAVGGALVGGIVAGGPGFVVGGAIGAAIMAVDEAQQQTSPGYDPAPIDAMSTPSQQEPYSG